MGESGLGWEDGFLRNDLPPLHPAVDPAVPTGILTPILWHTPAMSGWVGAQGLTGSHGSGTACARVNFYSYVPLG